MRYQLVIMQLASIGAKRKMQDDQVRDEKKVRLDLRLLWERTIEMLSLEKKAKDGPKKSIYNVIKDALKATERTTCGLPTGKDKPECC